MTTGSGLEPPVYRVWTPPAQGQPDAVPAGGGDVDQAAPPAPDGRRRWGRWIGLGVVLVVVLALCVPAAVVGGWFVRETVRAGEGAGSPGAALLSWVLTMDDGPDATGVDRWVVAERQHELRRQRAAFIAEMDRDRTASGWGARLEVASAPAGQEGGEAVDGDRARVVQWMAVAWSPPAERRSAGLLWHVGPPQPWRAETRRDSGGWRLWSVQTPAWCGGYSRCAGPPAPAGSASSSSSTSTAPAPPPTSPAAPPSPTENPRGRPEDYAPCGARDPFKTMRSCPPSPGG